MKFRIFLTKPQNIMFIYENVCKFDTLVLYYVCVCVCVCVEREREHHIIFLSISIK